MARGRAWWGDPSLSLAPWEGDERRERLSEVWQGIWMAQGT